MYFWRITKYNPFLRDDQGRYLHGDWTACSDIGKKFEGKILTLAEYMRVEDAYVNAVVSLMKCVGISSLCIEALEKKNRQYEKLSYDNHMFTVYKKLRKGSLLSLNEIESVVRLALREDIWCKLKYSSFFYVHFGYDYYMYIGSAQMCKKEIQKIQEMGLYVEEQESPYSD